MGDSRSKVLILAGQATLASPAVSSMRSCCDLTEVQSIDQAIDVLRAGQFDAVFSDSSDFLPLERALVSQQASLILNTIGEGVCIVDGEGRSAWMNKKMQAWAPRLHEKIRRTCREAFELFSKQVSPANPDGSNQINRSKRYTLNIEDQQFLEMIISPVISPLGIVVQTVAVIWDATGSRRMQQKIDAIDKAGRELVRLDSDEMNKLNVQQRLKLLEEKIISYTRELLHFDHFAIRLLDGKTNKLELVISLGLPPDACNVELFADAEGNGISGYVAATGRSYICPDVQRDVRYVIGAEQAKSTLTVPLRLQDKVIGIFNIESKHFASFNEDDRQFAEIFGRYVAIALHILDLLRVERVGVAHKVADDVNAEVAGPLNDIALDAAALMDSTAVNDELRDKLQSIIENAASIRKSLSQAAKGPNVVYGASDVVGEVDPLISGADILVADDEPEIRSTIVGVLRKYHANVESAANGAEAIEKIRGHAFHLVVSDIKMPDKTGYDVFAAARKASDALPVILMTGFGYDPSHSIVRASQEGLAAVLFKPFKVEQLLTEVRKALKLAPAR